MGSPTAFDIIVLTALAAGLVTGFMRGFVQEILSIAALALAFAVLRIAHEPLSAALADSVSESGGAVLAFVLIMGIVWGGGKFVAARIGQRTRSSVIGPADRLLGAGFGVLKALMIVATLFMLATLAYDVVFGARSARPQWLESSRTYPLLRATSGVVSAMVAQRLDEAPAGAPAAETSTP